MLGYRKNVVRENLANSFPEKTHADRLGIEKKYYRYLGDLIVESIKTLSISKKEVMRRMVPMDNQTNQLVADYFASGKSILGVAGHYCNWEMAALSCSMMTDQERLVVYKPLKNKVFDELFIKSRSRFGAELVAMKDILKKLVRTRDKRSFTILLSDQTPVQESVQYFTNFLNQPTAVFLGVEKLAKVLEAVVVYCNIKCVKRGYYSYNFITLTNEPKNTAEHEITNQHVAHLEQLIRDEPQYWLWSHRRWKFKPAN
jgi:KDO2-lipid IV(A) lauroyltransferase